jgi:hypothetical protein
MPKTNGTTSQMAGVMVGQYRVVDRLAFTSNLSFL